MTYPMIVRTRLKKEGKDKKKKERENKKKGRENKKRVKKIIKKESLTEKRKLYHQGERLKTL